MEVNWANEWDIESKSSIIDSVAKDSRDENVGPQTSITQIGGEDSLMSELKIQLARDLEKRWRPGFLNNTNFEVLFYNWYIELERTLI